MGSAFGDAETVVTRWMRFWCKDDNLTGEMKCIWQFPQVYRVPGRPAAPPCPAGLVLVSVLERRDPVLSNAPKMVKIG